MGHSYRPFLQPVQNLRLAVPPLRYCGSCLPSRDLSVIIPDMYSGRAHVHARKVDT
jgi:hypothetical protein